MNIYFHLYVSQNDVNSGICITTLLSVLPLLSSSVITIKPWRFQGIIDLRLGLHAYVDCGRIAATRSLYFLTKKNGLLLSMLLRRSHLFS